MQGGLAMEHRKFKKLVANLADELTTAQALKLIEALRARGDGDEVQALIEQHLSVDLKCPRCGASHVQRWGVEHKLQRYKCMDCGRTFNALTGTPLARLRHRSRWLRYSLALNSSLSVRKAATQAKIDRTTSFRWRHRFLKAQNASKDQSLIGIVEIDETFILESCKGQRKLARDARKRGGKAEKPGLSSEQIPILIACDRAGNMIDAVLPDRSEEAVSKVLKDALSKTDALLCMDGDKALIAFAKKQELEYELIIASQDEHVHEKVLHIQHVNSYVSGLKKWLARFNGVATKYLQTYLGWRRMLDKTGTSLTRQGCLAAALG